MKHADELLQSSLAEWPLALGGSLRKLAQGLAGLGLLQMLFLSLAGAEQAPTPKDLADMTLEDLMKVPVTSVARRAEALSESAGAISVISQDDIRRSGATTIAEALRLAPGMDVARVDGSQWAIGSRGFNDVFANKLLVMIDGRSVYTPLFSGVFWDVQDVMMEDIDRIEVIRGPGATLWGANAVNGVINIMSKSAKDTQGGLLTLGGGNEDRALTGLRYGDKLGEHAYFRVYGTYANRAESPLASGGDSHDAWQKEQGGFRIDWDVSERDLLTFQGDGYGGLADQIFTTYAPSSPGYTKTVNDQVGIRGGNLLSRWTHEFSEDSDLKAQFYYDHTERHPIIFHEDRNTYDLDLQHHLAVLPRNDIVWGLGFRSTSDRVANTPTVALTPDHRTDELFSAFVQDEIPLVPERLRLTLGSKFEHNSYTGFEVEPGARVAWTPHERQMVWGSVSRAVRTPSRAEDDIAISRVVPPGGLFPGSPAALATTYGNANIVAEDVIAYELGYRAQPFDQLTFDLALFYNTYDHLRSTEPGPSPTQPVSVLPPPGLILAPLHLENKLDGETYGVELGPTWRVTDWWRLRPSYTYLHMAMHHDSGSLDQNSILDPGRSPENQFALRSSMDLPYNFSLDCALRYVDELRTLKIPSYTTMDVRLAWRPRRNLEFAIVGQNLFQPSHDEFAASFITTPLTEVERSVYGKLTWWF